MKIIKLIILLLVVMFSLKAHSVQIVHYENKPIVVHLTKGKERIISFGDHIAIGLSRGMKDGNLLRAQSAQGSLYLLPHKKFTKQRVQIKRLSDNHIILLDLISDDKRKSLEEIKVVMAHENQKEPSEAIPSNKVAPIITPVDLTRYAAQRLYGPTRLHKSVQGIKRSQIFNKNLIDIFNKLGKKVNARVIYAIQGGGYHLSAIYIKNISDKPLTLDYLDLKIPFSHATFQHHFLSARGGIEDSTVLYLIDDEPMNNTLYPWDHFKPLKIGAKK